MITQNSFISEISSSLFKTANVLFSFKLTRKAFEYIKYCNFLIAFMYQPVRLYSSIYKIKCSFLVTDICLSLQVQYVNTK